MLRNDSHRHCIVLIIILLLSVILGCESTEMSPARQENQTPFKQTELETKQQPPLTQNQKDPDVNRTDLADADVKGIYVPPQAMKGSKWNNIMALLKETELNAVVLDVKDDYGRLTFPTSVPLAKQIKADQRAFIQNPREFLTRLRKDNIYTIARIVTFKDPYLAARQPGFAMKHVNGTIWKDERGVRWVDPYKEEVWHYNIAIAEEALKFGFDEVQFDYVRFPENSQRVDKQIKYDNKKQRTKSENIESFLQLASKRIHKMGGALSADVFGLVTTAKGGTGIGQEWKKIAPTVDAISPMIYPSHYAPGSYGVPHPDLDPSAIVKKALEDAKNQNSKLKMNQSNAEIIRPWLQDFTASWIVPHQKYGTKEVKEQIQAVKATGLSQYLLWNPSGRYSLQGTP